MMNIGEIIQQRYRLDSLLGQGSMGATYKAFDKNTQRPVAVKVLHFSRMQEWKVLELFEREAKVLQRLSHPRIPKYIDYFSFKTSTEVRFVLVQEYIEGKTLQQVVEEGWRGTEPEILNMFQQLVEILEYLHAFNPPVIHRDINPKNIILDVDKNVYLVDFGAVQDSLRTTFLSGSTIAGTFGYMPFEQFSGQTVPASDYYALGATLLYLLTHRHPSEFPTEGLKLHFHSYLQASPAVMHLLNGLLEPVVENRLASPEEIKKHLHSGSEKLRLQLSPTEKPYGSKIQKRFEGENRIHFQIPVKRGWGPPVVCGLCLVGLMVFNWMIGLPTSEIAAFLSIIWIIGVLTFFGSAIVTVKMLSQTYLELTPEQIIRRCSFWRFDYSQQVPTALINNVEIVPQNPLTNEQTQYVRLHAGAKLLTFGFDLTPPEKEWMRQEIQEYVDTYVKPRSKSTEKPYGSKIMKIIRTGNRVCFRIPRKIAWGTPVWFKVFIFWLAFLVWICLVRTPMEGFPGISIPFWFIGGMGFLGTITVMGKMPIQTHLELTPKWAKIRYSLLGLGYSRRLPTASIHTVDVSTRTLRNGQTIDEIALHADTKSLKFGSHLTPAEREWLVQEIKEYLAKYGRGENDKA